MSDDRKVTLFWKLIWLVSWLIAVVLILNGLQRIISYGDWPHGLTNIGIGFVLIKY